MAVNEKYEELIELAQRWEQRAKDCPDTPAGKAAAVERRKAAAELREVIE